MAELSLDLGLTEDQMADLIQAAILEKIGPEQRDRLIAQALEFLVKPTTTRIDPLRPGADKPISPLMQAFQMAMNRAMQSVVEEMVVQNPEVLAKVHSMVGEVVTDFLTKPESDAMGRGKDTLAQAFANIFTATRY